jgi:hypothetical protein
MGIADPAEASAEPVVVERHEHGAAVGQSREESLEFVDVITVDPE